jgi:hypothetical protein
MSGPFLRDEVPNDGPILYSAINARYNEDKWVNRGEVIVMAQRLKKDMNMRTINIAVIGLLFFLCLPLLVFGQSPDQELKCFEPLLNRKWTGILRAPNGSEGKISLAFESLADGKIVKFRRDNFERKVFAEGYFYWNDIEKRIAYFSIGTGGNFAEGFVTVEAQLLIIEGKAFLQKALPPPSGKQSFEFRNEFELTADGKLIDRYFQNASGTMQPCHVIEFISEK